MWLVCVNDCVKALICMMVSMIRRARVLIIGLIVILGRCKKVKRRKLIFDQILVS